MKLNTGNEIILYFVGIFFVTSRGCQLNLLNPAVSFMFVEVEESHPSGTKLPGEFKFTKAEGEILRVVNVDSLASKYIRTVVNPKCNCIQFFLKENKTLQSYRNESWTPSLEYEFELSCSKHRNTYTYMLGIKDDNLYPPKFISEAYQAELQYTNVSGYRIQSNFTNDIIVVDDDFNKNHTNFTVLCEGKDCCHFEFKPEYLKFQKGHHYKIKVHVNGSQNLEQFNSRIRSKEQFSVNLSLDDGLHTKSMANAVQFDLTIGLEGDEPPLGSTQGDDQIPQYLVYIIAGSVLLVMFLTCSGTVTYFSIRSRRAKHLLRQLTEAEIREFLEGNASIGTVEKRSVDVNTPIMALPYNQAFEIQRDKLRIDETTILGTGAFGIVWKGSVVYSNGDGITVAIKTVKRNVGILYFKALLSELKIMAYIGKHPNIVIIFKMSKNLRKSGADVLPSEFLREVYIALQYCALGNFHNYLKCRRDRFSNLVLNGNLQLPNSPIYSHIYSNNGSFSKSISTMDLLKWATQIANGLQYLESLGVIHGDLATRNVLLDEYRTAKIGDFGLSRRLIDYSNYYYTRTSQAPLPWKWMAPESLKDMRFSKKSDIWSFGIVLWEVFTLGQTPYPGLNWDESFVERLDKGMRPVKPTFAPTLVYDIMTDCWNLDPHDRPAILDIKRALENITSCALRQNGDKGYMKFGAEKSILRMMNEDEQGYLEPNYSQKKHFIDS